MAVLNTPTFGDLVANKHIIFTKGIMSIAPAARESGIFKLGTWGDGQGNTKEYSEFELENFATQKDEGAQTENAQVQQGYSKTVSPIRFAKQISITWEMRKYNKYTSAVQKLTGLGKLVTNRYEMDLQHRIGFGTATDYTTKEGKTRSIDCGDGYALYYSGHTLTGSSTTYRNILANNPQLSSGSLEAMEKMNVENTLNNFGEKMVLDYDILWTTDDANTLNTARELIKSTSKISAPNSGVINTNEGKYKHVKLAYVNTDANGANDTDKAKYWGLSSSAEEGSQLYSDLAEAPNVSALGGLTATNAENFSTDDWFFKGSGAWSIVAVVGRGNSLSKGDGSA